MRLFNTTKFTIMLSAATLAVAQPPATPQPAQPPATPPTTPAPVKEPAKEATANDAAGPLVVVAPETVVLTVGGYKVTRAQFEELLTVLPDNMRAAAAAPGPGRRQVGEQLAELKSIAEEARKRKVDQTPGIQQLIAIQTDNASARALSEPLPQPLHSEQ